MTILLYYIYETWTAIHTTVKYRQTFVNMHRYTAHVWVLHLIFTYLSKFGDSNNGKTHSSVQRYKMFGENKANQLFLFCFFNPLCRFRSAFPSAKRLRSAFMSTRMLSHGSN